MNHCTSDDRTSFPIVISLVVVGFATLMYGLMAFDWGFREIGSLFLWMGIAIPIAGGMSAASMIEKKIEG